MHTHMLDLLSLQLSIPIHGHRVVAVQRILTVPKECAGECMYESLRFGAVSRWFMCHLNPSDQAHDALGSANSYCAASIKMTLLALY
eukprot:1161981-Pelagomonas_calceolata.AAC.19